MGGRAVEKGRKSKAKGRKSPPALPRSSVWANSLAKRSAKQGAGEERRRGKGEEGAVGGRPSSDASRKHGPVSGTVEIAPEYEKRKRARGLFAQHRSTHLTRAF